MAEDNNDSLAAGGSAVGPVRLSNADKRDWMRLIRTDRIGPVTFHELIAQFGSAASAIEAVQELGRRGGGAPSLKIPSAASADCELEAAEKAGAHLLASCESLYPQLLKHIPAPPPLLYARGDPQLAERNTVAIVGSRNASAVGRQLTAEIARDLGNAGAVIVSGLARGIDTAEHEAALDTGTIAVIAGGIDSVYPPENAALQDAIAERGLLLSESPPGFSPRGQDFPRRNRIISGVSSGVIVVEAATKSGSLITARLALEQGREVFAVPGHPLDPRASGTNKLIKAGACLVTCAEDVLSELFGAFSRIRDVKEAGQRAPFKHDAPGICITPDPPASKDCEAILAALSLTPIPADSLLRQTGLTPRSLTVALLQLDLAGYIDRHHNECISLKPGQKVGF